MSKSFEDIYVRLLEGGVDEILKEPNMEFGELVR